MRYIHKLEKIHEGIQPTKESLILNADNYWYSYDSNNKQQPIEALTNYNVLKERFGKYIDIKIAGQFSSFLKKKTLSGEYRHIISNEEVQQHPEKIIWGKHKEGGKVMERYLFDNKDDYAYFYTTERYLKDIESKLKLINK
ncbi:MAG: hypothetical protein LBM99_03620 [Bacillales bacterium]|jgi:hypothetical protein|nr:hypothetical protein [Bacillales bacterium]